MKSNMTHDFSKVATIQAERSSFDRSFTHKLTLDAGKLVPFYVDDVIPGDTFNLKTAGFARLSTPLFPVMDNMFMDTHFFFVPLRLVWDNSRKFFGEQANSTDSIDYQLPQFNSFTPTEESLSDYLGLPIGNAMTPVSIYHRGSNLIYNEWFRDQNLQDSLVVDTDDGPDNIADYIVNTRGKRYDYFTSCLPWPQKGDAVTLPFAQNIPITGIGTVSGTFSTSGLSVTETGGASVLYPNSDSNASSILVKGTSASGGEPEIYADLSSVAATTINDLREAFQVQKLLERDARGGTRYSELVKNHFGVNFYDVSYRPEFLGGGSTPINMTPVPQTGGNASFGGEADLGAYATSSFTNHGFTKSFVEHGFVMGFVSVRADLTYQQGIPRHFLKSTRYDTFFPSLAHLGEQEVTNAEIYYTGTATDDDVFGYNERYSEYRYHPSRISGKFRSTAASPLDAWHLSQEFSTLPTLGNTFIKEDPPIDRVIATPTEPHFIMDTFTSLRCARPIPVNGTPGMIDHF